MTGRGTDLVLRPLPGQGVLARCGELVLLCSADEGAREHIGVLLEVLADVAAANGDGRRLGQRLANLLAAASSRDDDDFPDLCAFGPAGPALAVIARGRAMVRVSARGAEVRLNGQDAVTWVDRMLPMPFDSVRAELGSVPADAEPDGWSRLTGGVMRASGFVYTPVGQAVALTPMAKVAPPPAELPPVAAASENGGRRAEPAGVAAGTPRPNRPSPSPRPSLWRRTAADDAAAATPTVAEQLRDPAAQRSEVTAARRRVDQSAPFEATRVGARNGDGVDATGAHLTGAHSAGNPTTGAYPVGPAGVGQNGPPPAVPAQNGSPPPAGRAAEPGEASVGPIVHGVTCANGHFNDPRLAYCVVCGISVRNQTAVARTGPRPSLGVLVLDDGATFSLDGGYVVGREPEWDDAVTAGRARPMRIADPGGVVSRVHARIELEGWDVAVVDLGSANGTHVCPAGADAWTRIPPHTPVPITPGTRVVFGRRSVRFEAQREQ